MSHPDDGMLQELLDGELAPADDAAVRAHLTGCAACSALLDELRLMQVEAGSIVARLELDPPILRASIRRRGRSRRVNLRMLGLAASTVLVAGTSFLLLRQAPVPRNAVVAATDSGANASVASPLEERDLAPAQGARPTAAPAAPGAKGAGKLLADTAPVVAHDDEALLRLKGEANAPAAPPSASAGAISATAPAANRGDDAVAAKPAPVVSVTIADAEARLGGKVLTIAGLTPRSVEIVEATPGSALGVRQLYLVDGVKVVLVQRNAVPATVDARAQSQEEVTSKQRAVETEKKDRGEGFAAVREVTGSTRQLQKWRYGGVALELEGALPPDSLDALARRVR